MSGRVRRLLTGGSILLFGSAVFFVLSFAQNVLLARTLGTGGFGAWAVVAATWFLLHALFTQGAEEALLRELAAGRGEDGGRRMKDILAGGARVTLATRLLCAGLLVIASFLLPQVTDRPPMVALAMRIQAITVMVDAVEPFWRCIMRDRRRFTAIAVQPATTLVGVLALLGGLAALHTLTVPLVALCVLIASMARAVVLLLMLRVELRDHYRIGGITARVLAVWRHPLAVSAGYWQSVRLGLVSNFFAAATRQGDVLILMWFVGDAHLGIYRIARMVVETVIQAVRLLGVVVYGDMMGLVDQGLIPELLRFLRTISLVVGGVALAGVPVLVLFVDEILALLYGPEFTEAALPLLILLPSLVLSVTLFWTNELLYALRRLTFYTAVMAGLLVVFVGVGSLLSMAHGVIGMAATASGVSILATLSTAGYLLFRLSQRRAAGDPGGGRGGKVE